MFEEGVTLHALYEIRVAYTGPGPWKFLSGIGMYTAGANGTFAAAPSLVHKDTKKDRTFVENGTGECVATTCFQPLRPVFGKLERDHGRGERGHHPACGALRNSLRVLEQRRYRLEGHSQTEDEIPMA